MRLSPPEPTFLDMRNAILLADQAAGQRDRTQIWAVFAQRGMGYFATSEPLQDFSTPPAPGVPRGAITGVVTDADTGRAIAGATAAIGSLADGPDRLAGTTGADGAYSIGGVPARTYPNLVVDAPGYDRAVLEVTVPTGATIRVDVALQAQLGVALGRRAGAPGAGQRRYADQGCGPDAAVDQLPTTAWSTVASAGGKSMVVALPQAGRRDRPRARSRARPAVTTPTSATRDYRDRDLDRRPGGRGRWPRPAPSAARRQRADRRGAGRRARGPPDAALQPAAAAASSTSRSWSCHGAPTRRAAGAADARRRRPRRHRRRAAGRPARAELHAAGLGQADGALQGPLRASPAA